MLVDAAYYNKPVVLQSVLHSGDSRHFVGEHVAVEGIAIRLDSLPSEIAAVALVVNRHGEGTAEAEFGSNSMIGITVNTRIAVVSDGEPNGRVVAELTYDADPAPTDGGVVLALLHRCGAGAGAGAGTGSAAEGTPPWCARKVDMATTGANFFQSLPAVSATLCAELIPQELVTSHILRAGLPPFSMSKGEILKIPRDLFVQGTDNKTKSKVRPPAGLGGADLFVGLGWRCDGVIDVDASIIAGDGQGKFAGVVNYDSLKGIPGVERESLHQYCTPNEARVTRTPHVDTDACVSQAR